MKKLLVVSFSAFVAGSAAAVLSIPLLVNAGPPPVRDTLTPGDTNCDQKLDLSDAIFTLNYLFQGTAFPP